MITSKDHDVVMGTVAKTYQSIDMRCCLKGKIQKVTLDFSEYKVCCDERNNHNQLIKIKGDAHQYYTSKGSGKNIEEVIFIFNRITFINSLSQIFDKIEMLDIFKFNHEKRVYVSFKKLSIYAYLFNEGKIMGG